MSSDEGLPDLPRRADGGRGNSHISHLSVTAPSPTTRNRASRSPVGKLAASLRNVASRSPVGKLSSERHHHYRDQSEIWDSNVFLGVLFSHLLLPVSVLLNCCLLTKKGRAAQNKVLALQLSFYALLCANAVLYVLYVNDTLFISQTEIVGPVALYTLIAALHASECAAMAPDEMQNSLGYFAFRLSMVRTLWKHAPEQAVSSRSTLTESGIAFLKKIVVEEATPFIEQLDLDSQHVWCVRTPVAGATPQRADSRRVLFGNAPTRKPGHTGGKLGFITGRSQQQGESAPVRLGTVEDALASASGEKSSESNSNAVTDAGEGEPASPAEPAGSMSKTTSFDCISCRDYMLEVCGLTLGMKRWKKFKWVPFFMAGLYAALPTVVRLFAPLPSAKTGYAQVIDIYLVTCSACVSFAEASVVLRILHRCMMDYCRRYQTNRYMSAALDPVDSSWYSLPQLVIDCSWQQSPHAFGECIDNISGWLAIRSCLLACESTQSAHNERSITLILGSELALCIWGIVETLVSPSNLTTAVLLKTHYVMALYVTAVGAFYLFRILKYIVHCNAQQLSHRGLLLSAKLTVVQSRWTHTTVVADPGARARRAAALASDTHRSGCGEIERFLETTIACLTTNDSLCKLFGMAIDQQLSARLVAVVAAGLASQLWEILMA